MRNFSALFRRQLAAYFYSPVAYVTLAAFLFVAGLGFTRLITQSLEERMQLGDLMFGSMFFWVMVLAAVALITMHLIAEEKRSGTIETLLTAPVTDTQVVLAKYGAALALFAVMCVPTVLYAVILKMFAAGSQLFDPLSLLTGYAMLFLIGASYIAFGLFASALTRSQAAAAVLCFTGISLAFFCDNFQYVLHDATLESVLNYVSSIQHILDFSRGVIDTRPVVLCFSGIAFFLFATVKVIESRHWK